MAAGTADVLTRLAAPEGRRDPYPLLRWLREQEPVHRTDDGLYLLSTHADVLWTLRRSGSVFLGRDRDQLLARMPDAHRHRSLMTMLNGIGSKNPPDHGRLRTIMSRGFTARRVSALQPRITAVCDRLLAGLAGPLQDGEIVDLQHAFIRPLTVQVFSELLGVPAADRGWLAAAAADVSVSFGRATEQQLSLADDQTGRIHDHFRELVRQRRRTPQDDLITAVADPRDGIAGTFGDDQLITMLWTLWLSGFNNTTGSIGNGVLAVFEHPDQLDWLSGGLARSTRFTNEVIRHRGPVMFTAIPRIAARDVTLSGMTIPAGSDVRLMLAAANRDPAVFPGPDRFDPARDTTAHLGFGQGIHLCLGAALARAQIAISLPRLHARFPDLVAAGDPLWEHDVRRHAVRRLPVALDR